MKRILFAGIIAVLAGTPALSETKVDGSGNPIQTIVDNNDPGNTSVGDPTGLPGMGSAGLMGAPGTGVDPADNDPGTTGPAWLPRKQHLLPQKQKHRIEDAPNVRADKTG